MPIFLVVGDGPLRGAIHFAGSEKDVYGAMVDMDLLVLTSRAEGLPNVLVEAKFLGVPVVATRAGGAPETVDHGRSAGFLRGITPVLAHAAEVAAGKLS
jgi:glycosyltransferase involved in cell wall biosynthesis